jgi:hypothetical protein
MENTKLSAEELEALKKEKERLDSLTIEEIIKEL